MEYRQLGGSGFMVPALTFGTGTFGGGNEFFKAWGSSDVAEATRLVAICLDAGLSMFDSADALRQNLGAVGWKLTPEQVARLDKASTVTLPYPYWHQRSTFSDRNPPAV